MTTPPTILRADERHVADVVRLLAVQLREHGISIDDGSIAGAVRGAIADPRLGFVLVAELDGRGAGVAYVSMVWALEHGGRSAWLEELYVPPELRGAGIGTALLRAAIEECRSIGCAALDIEIDADHERVRPLYERHGFTPLPRRRMVRNPL